MIFVIATMQGRPEKREALLAGARIVIAATRKEEGCLSYDLHQSVSDPDCLVFVERWTTREALGAHFETPHLQVWRGVAGECIARPTKVEIISPANVEQR